MLESRIVFRPYRVCRTDNADDLDHTFQKVHFANSGVDDMIKIFGDFRQFSAKQLAFLSKSNVMINI
jgi:hypothetical protein